MPKRKRETVRLSVFKGRTRHLTEAIFWILAQNPPLVIWDIYLAVRKQKGLRYTKYAVVNQRVRTLENRGYLEKVGTRKIKQTRIESCSTSFYKRLRTVYFMEKVEIGS
ncbi:MAG: hypothetical protein KGD70_16765 [Candidatus Lokiarchaeota archaeon]|nr:hypothetical protein [Candidatus Lokiarchaeota archaeon]